jgi:hypothetical protein
MLPTNTGEKMFEYACHEANLTMANMLANGRRNGRNRDGGWRPRLSCGP